MIDLLTRTMPASAGGCTDNASAGKPLAEIIVGVALELEGDAARQERAKALPGRAGKPRHNGVRRQALVAIALGDCPRQHGADGTIGILDRERHPNRIAALDRRLRLRDQLAIEHIANLVVLPLAIESCHFAGMSGFMNDFEKSRPTRLALGDQLAAIEHLHLSDHLVESAIAHLGHEFADFLGNKEEIIDDMLGLAPETLAQHRILSGHANRAGVEMAFTHHHAAGGDQRRRGEAEFIGAKERADHNVAAGADAAIDLHRDAAAQPICDQRLMGFGKSDFPRRSGMLDRG